MKFPKIFGQDDPNEEKKAENLQEKGKEPKRRVVKTTSARKTNRQAFSRGFEQPVRPISTFSPYKQDNRTNVGSKSLIGGTFLPEYKPLVKKKLTVLMIENTNQMAEQKVILTRILKSLQVTDLLCVINYGSTVHKGKIIKASEWNASDFLREDDLGEKACLYDALVDLEAFVSTQYFKTEENEKEKVQINSVEVIGIGTCKDNGSKNSEDSALERFYWLSNKTYVITKYFCLTEDNFLDAAKVGFRSIGAIIRN